MTEETLERANGLKSLKNSCEYLSRIANPSLQNSTIGSELSYLVLKDNKFRDDFIKLIHESYDRYKNEFKNLNESNKSSIWHRVEEEPDFSKTGAICIAYSEECGFGTNKEINDRFTKSDWEFYKKHHSPWIIKWAYRAEYLDEVTKEL